MTAMPTAPALALRAKPLRVFSLRASIGIALALGLAGCALAKPENQPSGAEEFKTLPPAKEYSASSNIFIWADPDTGCKYLVFSSYKKGGITPRLRADGEPDCPAQPKEINP